LSIEQFYQYGSLSTKGDIPITDILEEGVLGQYAIIATVRHRVGKKRWP
jgi:hypothetical protein